MRTMTYRRMPVAAGPLAARRMAHYWPNTSGEKTRERSSVNAWEDEGGALATKLPTRKPKGSTP
jgi:hypothetical protein